MDEVHAELLGTCGVVVNTAEHMDTCLDGVDLALDVVRDERSVAVHAARVHAGDGEAPRRRLARDHRHVEPERLLCATSSRTTCSSASRFRARGGSWSTTSTAATGTCRSWNPLSVVGPAHAAGRRDAGRGDGLHARVRDPVRRRLHRRAAWIPDEFLPRFTFFFDISMSFFEEIAKFRAGRRIWARLARERFGARDPRARGFKFHAQTSGVDLTRAAAAQQRRARHRAGDGRHLRRPAVAAHRRVRRGAVVPDAVRRTHRGRHAEHPARGSAPDRRHRPARRLATTSRR